MSRRLNTIIIVPHSKAKFVKFSFTTPTLIVACCGVIVALILSVVAISYTGNAVSRRAEVQRLRSENLQLAEVNRQLEQTVSSVQGRLDEFEQRTSRLALAAGMETETLDFPDETSQAERVGTGGPYDRLPESPAMLQIQGEWISRSLAQVEETLEQRAHEFACTPSIAPVMGVMTDGFGRRKDPFTGHRAFHRGLDMSARRGTPVVAPADGVVVFAGRNGGLGKVIRVSHGLGVITVFGHLHKIMVEPGQEVSRGSVIGQLGNTGRSTGPHLHYEVHVDGEAVNPLSYILASP